MEMDTLPEELTCKTLFDIEGLVLQAHIDRLVGGLVPHLQDVAETLGVSRHTLRRRLQKHNIRVIHDPFTGKWTQKEPAIL